MHNLEVRIERGSIKNAELAKKVGVSVRTISKWFNNDMDALQRGRVLKAIKEINEEKEKRD